MVQLDLPCGIFDENESEEFQTFLKIVDALAKPELEKLLPKINADEYNEFKIYLKRVEILDEEVLLNNSFYGERTTS